MYKKAKAATRIIQAQYSYNNKVYNAGFKMKRNLNYIKENEEALEDPIDIEVVNKESMKNSFLINPNHTYKRMWDLIVVILLAYTALWTPYNVCFITETSDFQYCLDLVVDSLFLTDIVVTFNTAYEDHNGLLEISRRKVSKRYITGWFFIDLVTSIPF